MATAASTPPAPPVVTRAVVGKNLLSVLSILVLILLLVLLAAAVALAKSGLMNVPLFSRFYRGPVPVRTVSSAPMNVDALRVLIGSRLLSQVNAGKKPPYIVRVNERELTGALGSAVDEVLRDQEWKTRQAQLAITPEFMEFTGSFRREPVLVEMRLRLVPAIQEGALSVTPVDIRLGDFPVSPGLSQELAGILFTRDFGSWRLTYGEVQLQRVELGDGYLNLTVAPAKP